MRMKGKRRSQESGVRSQKAKTVEVPTYTLRADRRFDILAMVTIVSMAEAGEAPAEKLAELRAKMREFELYEEKYLR